VRKSCVICGGTAAGKTTLLRAMAADIPAWERLITIEDSLELGLDRYPDLHPDVVALEAREPNLEGQGGVSLAELVRWALRMSPDRVIVGEARGEEVLALLNAMSQGTDGSMTTLHASSSPGEGTVMTVLLPINGPETKVEETQAVTPLHRDPDSRQMPKWHDERKRAL